MKKWYITYYLGDMKHCQIIKGAHEAEAIMDFLYALYNPGIMHSFHIEPYCTE